MEPLTGCFADWDSIKRCEATSKTAANATTKPAVAKSAPSFISSHPHMANAHQKSEFHRDRKKRQLAFRRRKLWSTNTFASASKAAAVGLYRYSAPGKHARNSLARMGPSCADLCRASKGPTDHRYGGSTERCQERGLIIGITVAVIVSGATAVAMFLHVPR